MKGAIWIFILSHFILEPRKATIIEAFLNGFILCIQPKRCLKEDYYCLCPRYKNHPSQRWVPGFFLFSLSSKSLKQDRPAWQLSRNVVFVARSQRCLQQAGGHGAEGKEEFDHRRAAEAAPGKGAHPPSCGRLFPRWIKPSFLAKTASWVWQRGGGFSLPARARTQEWVNVDNRSAAPRERMRTPWVIRQYSVHIYLLPWNSSIPWCWLWLCLTNYVGNSEAFYKGRYSHHTSDVCCIYVFQTVPAFESPTLLIKVLGEFHPSKDNYISRQSTFPHICLTKCHFILLPGYPPLNSSIALFLPFKCTNYLLL